VLSPAGRRGLATTAVLLVVPLLGGCGADPVRVDPPPLPAELESACRTFLDDLPPTLAEEEPTEVEPADVLAAAYGDPAIVVTCTDAAPPEFDRFSACDQVNQVGWFVPESQVDEPEGDVEVYALSHSPIVRLEVPGEYRPNGVAAALAELAEPIRADLTQIGPCL